MNAWIKRQVTPYLNQVKKDVLQYEYTDAASNHTEMWMISYTNYMKRDASHNVF